MIPKIIHYCWLSNDEYPELVNRCVDSWKRILPEYEIMLWDLKRFQISSSLWVSQAYKTRKYAFAADYIRCFALYNYGGIYLDSDVEVVKSFDNLLSLPYFIGKDMSNKFEPAIMGFKKNNAVLKDMLDYYDNRNFINEDGSYNTRPIPDLMEEIVRKKYSVKDVCCKEAFINEENTFCLFPSEFFSPKRQDNFMIEKTKETYSIHHFNASWYSFSQRLFRFLSKIFGYKFVSNINNIIKKK